MREVDSAKEQEADAVRRSSDLAAITARARSDFGLSCFWNAPNLADPVEEAQLVTRRLRKYGGRRGWAVAIGIDNALRQVSGAQDGVDAVSARGAAASRAQSVAE